MNQIDEADEFRRRFIMDFRGFVDTARRHRLLDDDLRFIQPSKHPQRRPQGMHRDDRFRRRLVARRAVQFERRAELAKVAAKYAEQAKVSVRNVRREGMEAVKKADGGEDEQKKLSEEVQKLTDEMVKKVDEMLAAKDAEIMQV